MSVVDLLRLSSVDVPRLSPDGSRLAYVTETSDRERVPGDSEKETAVPDWVE